MGYFELQSKDFLFQWLLRLGADGVQNDSLPKLCKGLVVLLHHLYDSGLC